MPSPSSTTLATLHVGVIVGSLRRASTTRLVAKALMAAAPAHVHCRFIEIGDLPLYNEDQDVEVAPEPPQTWARFRKEVAASNAILFVTPEYNRSIPAPLKNAVDIGSAPHAQGALNGRPAAIVSASPGRMGAFGANHHLRQSLVFLDMPTMQQPELYLGNSAGVVDDRGQVLDPAVAQLMTTFMDRFSQWAVQHIGVPA